jgi:murein DD-endopeptidase MepM/ murein hydrolase activator NlpD
MPTVPIVDQTAMGAQPYAAPGVTPFRNAAPEQMQQAGATLQQAGQTDFHAGQTITGVLNDQIDEARTKQAETSALSAVNQTLYDPQSGYLHQRGQAAIDGYEPAKQAVNKAVQDGLDSLSNPLQKHMFQQSMNQHLLTFGNSISDHYFDQASQYAGEAAVSRANSYATAASNAYSSYGQIDADGNPTGAFATNLATAEHETLQATQVLKGAPPDSDVAKEALLNLHTQVGTAAISQMMDDRAPYAKVQQIFSDLKDKGMLTLRAEDQLGKMVKAYSDQESTRTAVTQNLSDALRASQGQPTSSTGTPDYQFAVKGATITSSPYDPEQGAVTVSVAKGTNIQAPADGKVIQVGKNDDGDFAMQIQHADGSVTSFTGLQASNVKVGDQVQRGENVATSGTVGQTPAVQWSLADKNGNAVDPTKAGLAPVDITKITDEKVLGDALSRVRSQISDPYLQQQATSEMESVVRHNQQMQNVAQTQTYKQASDAFYSGGMNWRNIPPSVYNQLTPEQQQSFKDKQTEEVLKNYNQSQAFKEMDEVDLVSYFTQNPDMLTAANVDAARPKLANSTYLQLQAKAQSLQNNPQGVVEANAVNDRIKYFAQHAGVNVEPKTAQNKQTLADLTFRVQQDVDQLKTQNHGKATGDQVDKAIQQELIRHTTTTQRSPWDPRSIFGFSTSTVTAPLGAVKTVRGSDGKDHYLDRNNQDLGVVQ